MTERQKRHFSSLVGLAANLLTDIETGQEGPETSPTLDGIVKHLLKVAAYTEGLAEASDASAEFDELVASWMALRGVSARAWIAGTFQKGEYAQLLASEGTEDWVRLVPDPDAVNPVIAVRSARDGGTARLYMDGTVDGIDGTVYSLSPGFPSYEAFDTWLVEAMAKLGMLEQCYCRTVRSPRGFHLQHTEGMHRDCTGGSR